MEMTNIALPPRNDSNGLEARLLLAECRSPSFATYGSASAQNCMQLMDLVLWNRVGHPRLFGASSATLRAVVTARGQFAGFGGYPSYDESIAHRIQEMVNIANSARDGRSSAFRDHVQMAMDIADAPTIQDPSPGLLCAWRTTGSGSPGSSFTAHATVLGNDFYFITRP